MEGNDLGDLGVLLTASLVAGTPYHARFESGGREWVISMTPVTPKPEEMS